MTGILGAGANAAQATALGSMQFQTSQPGGVIPLVYGATRVAPNLIDYEDFTATPFTKGQQKGKSPIPGAGGVTTGGGKGSADAKAQGQYTYSASVTLGICQGPVNFGLVWWDKNICPMVALPGLTSLTNGYDSDHGTTPAIPDWESIHPGNALTYSGTATFSGENYQLGPSGALPNFSVEVIPVDPTAVNGCDDNPAHIVTDVLTNPRYGAGFPTANLDIAGTVADYGAYCDAAGIFLAPQLDQQTQAQQALSNIAQLTVSAIVWSGGLLKIIPYGDAPISATYWIVLLSGTTGGGDTLTLTFDSPGLGTVTATYNTQPSNVNTDTVDPSGPMGKLAQAVNGTSALTSYGISAGVVVSGVVIRMAGTDQSVTVSASSSAAEGSDGAESFSIEGPFARSWTPVTTVRASLGEDDFIAQESSVGSYLGVTPGSPALRMGAGPITGGFTDDPVTVSRSSPADAMNYVQLEVLDRAYSYNTQIVEVFDQGMVDLYGVRKDTSLKARAIVDPGLVGPTVAQLVLQRDIAFRNTYSFRIGWKWCLLEPMDLVEISDPYLGLENKVVRITSIAEDEEGTLSITAEDYFGASTGGQGSGAATGNAGTAAFYPKGAGGQGSAPFNNQPAPQVSAPVFVEPTPQLLASAANPLGISNANTTNPNSTPQLLIAVSAGSTQWGGATAYMSLDGASYPTRLGIVSRSTLGVTTTDLASGGTAVTVDLSASLGELQSVGDVQFGAGGTLSALTTPGGTLEFVTWQTATLVTGHTYMLSGIRRGLAGTPITANNVLSPGADIPAGSSFVLLTGGGPYAMTIPAQFAGKPLFFKFVSFNLTGGGAGSIADAVAYEYIPRGLGVSPSGYVLSRSPMAAEAPAATWRHNLWAPVESR